MFGICLLYIKFKTAKFHPEGQQLPLQYLERDVWNVPAIYQFTTATFDPGGQQFFCSTWNGMFGMRSLSSSRRRQGHSCKKRRATSKVAPPHTSRDAASFMTCEVALAALSMSCVRMRVASRLW